MMARIATKYSDILNTDIIVLDGLIYGVVKNEVDQMYPERRIVLVQLLSHYISGSELTDSNSMYLNPRGDDVVTKWNGVIWSGN